MPKGADSEEERGQILRFTVPPQTWKYLEWLSRNTVLGIDPKDVARQVLIAKLAEMRREEYKDPERA
jgi:hypothetical protein